MLAGLEQGDAMTFTWTISEPTESGVYWAYAKDIYGYGPFVWIVQVEDYKGRRHQEFQMDGAESEPVIEWRDNTHWKGPLEEPPPPEVTP